MILDLALKVGPNYLPYGTASGVKTVALKNLLPQKTFYIPARPSLEKIFCIVDFFFEPYGVPQV